MRELSLPSRYRGHCKQRLGREVFGRGGPGRDERVAERLLGRLELIEEQPGESLIATNEEHRGRVIEKPSRVEGVLQPPKRLSIPTLGESDVSGGRAHDRPVEHVAG